jgi:hypothetical protein
MNEQVLRNKIALLEENIRAIESLEPNVIERAKLTAPYIQLLAVYEQQLLAILDSSGNFYIYSYSISFILSCYIYSYC